MTRYSLTKPLSLGLALSVSVAALGACSDGGPARDATGQVTASTNVTILEVKSGDCVNLSEDVKIISSLPVTPCSDPHNGEVFAETTLPDGDYPGDSAANKQAEEFCRGAFDKFIGISFDDSEYAMYPIYPQKDSWDDYNDRTVLCIVTAENPVTGTLKGANK